MLRIVLSLCLTVALATPALAQGRERQRRSDDDETQAADEDEDEEELDDAGDDDAGDDDAGDDDAGDDDAGDDDAGEEDDEDDQVAPDEPDSASPIPWVLAGIGGASMVAGVVFALLGDAKYTDAAEAEVHTDASDALDSARSLTAVANGLFVAGAALVLFGIGWGSVEIVSADDGAGSARIGIGPGGLALAGTLPD